MKKSNRIHEAARLRDLYSYNILDTEPEADYSDLAELASLVSRCPNAAITFIDKKRQWFKALVGEPVKETPRKVSFCSHTILNDDVLVVPDTTSDKRFKKNPDVTAGLKIRFYAGYPIYSAQGNKLGAVCVFDQKPRTLTAAQIKTLKLISKQVTQLLELRLRNDLLKQYSQKILQNNEKTIESFFEGSSIPKLIFEIDTLRILQVNDAAVKKYGYSKEEFLKMSMFDLRTQKEKEKIHQLFRHIRNDNAVATYETVHQTKTATEINVEVSTHETVFLGKIARLATIVDCTERKCNENNLRIERLNVSSNLTKAKQDTATSVKQNIGRELHDNINQILSCTRLYLDMASNNEALRTEMIDRSKANIVEAISAIRQLSSSLVSGAGENFKLVDSIQNLVDSLSLANAFQLQSSISKEAENLPNDLKINLFRIIQEQMNNILKYARASDVTISIIISNSIQLLIKDNGIGFDPALERKGIGLNNIKNRAEFYNGTVQIASQPTKGVELLVQLPLVEKIKVAC